MNKLGIALSGGGARGIAHIGVLQALEEEEIFPTYIAGTSAGSLVGVLYAAGLKPVQMLKIAQETSLFRVFRLQLRLGLIDLSQVKTILAEYVKEDNFSALEKKLFVCVTNIEKGKWEIRQEGELFNTVVASCSIPVIFKPVKLDGQLYVDGGVLNNLPVEPLRIFCDKVIGVSVVPFHHQTEMSGMLEIAERSIDLVLNESMHSRLSQCDIALEIEGITKYGMFNFNKANEIYKLGYDFTKSRMDLIKKKLQATEYKNNKLTV